MFGDMVSIAQLTLVAAWTEPPDVAVAVLRRRSCTLGVHTDTLTSTVRIVQAFLFVLTPRSVIESVAPASSKKMSTVLATVFAVLFSLKDLRGGFTLVIITTYFIVWLKKKSTHVDIGAGPKSIR